MEKILIFYLQEIISFNTSSYFFPQMGFLASWEKIYVSFLTKSNFFPQAHIFSPTWGSQQVGGKNINLFLTEIIIKIGRAHV